MSKKKYVESQCVSLEEHTEQLKVQFIKQYSQKTSSRIKVCQPQRTSRNGKLKSQSSKLMRQKIKNSECLSPSILPADLKIIDGVWNDEVHAVRNENSSQTDSNISIVFDTNDDSEIVYSSTLSEMTKPMIKKLFSSPKNAEPSRIEQKSHQPEYSSILPKTSRYPLRSLVTLGPETFKSPPCLGEKNGKISIENVYTFIAGPPVQHPKKIKKSTLNGKKSKSIPKKTKNLFSAVSASSLQIRSSKKTVVEVQMLVPSINNDSNKFKFSNNGKSRNEPFSSINSQKSKAFNFTEHRESYLSTQDSSEFLEICASKNCSQLENIDFISRDSMNVDELGQLFATLIITQPTPDSFLVYRNGKRGSLISVKNRRIRKNHLKCSLARGQFMCTPKIYFTRQSTPSTPPLVEPNTINCQLEVNTILKKICTVTRKVPHFLYFEKYD